jgi:hypothetical protein
LWGPPAEVRASQFFERAVLSNLRPNQAAWLNLPPWPVSALAQGQGPERPGSEAREAINTFERAGINHHDGLVSLI